MSCLIKCPQCSHRLNALLLVKHYVDAHGTFDIRCVTDVGPLLEPGRKSSVNHQSHTDFESILQNSQPQLRPSRRLCNEPERQEISDNAYCFVEDENGSLSIDVEHYLRKKDPDHQKDKKLQSESMVMLAKLTEEDFKFFNINAHPNFVMSESVSQMWSDYVQKHSKKLKHFNQRISRASAYRPAWLEFGDDLIAKKSGSRTKRSSSLSPKRSKSILVEKSYPVWKQPVSAKLFSPIVPVVLRTSDADCNAASEKSHKSQSKSKKRHSKKTYPYVKVKKRKTESPQPISSPLPYTAAQNPHRSCRRMSSLVGDDAYSPRYLSLNELYPTDSLCPTDAKPSKPVVEEPERFDHMDFFKIPEELGRGLFNDFAKSAEVETDPNGRATLNNLMWLLEEFAPSPPPTTIKSKIGPQSQTTCA